MLKVIAKKKQKWVDTGIQVSDSSNIKKELYTSSNKIIDFFPDFIFVVEKKDGNVFVESIVNVLRGFKQDDLEDEDFQNKLYEKVKINYSDLSFEKFVNAILYVITPGEDDLVEIINAIKEEENEVEEQAEEDEEEEDQEEPEIRILRFKSLFGKLFDKPDLQAIYKKIQLNPYFIIAKTLYGNEPEYLSDNLTLNQQKEVENFIFSEHSTEKTEKILVKGVINLLYYKSLVNIGIKISDTGFVSLKIEPKKMFIDSDSELENIRKEIKRIHYSLTESNDFDVVFSSFEIKITYPKRFGFYTKNLIAHVENSEVKNSKVEYVINGTKIWFSSKEDKLNFTAKEIGNIDEIKKLTENVKKRVDYYLNSIGKINKYTLDADGKITLKTDVQHEVGSGKKIRIFNTNFDGVYSIEQTDKIIKFVPNKNTGLSKNGNFIFIGNVKKTSISQLRNAGLIIDSKECQKERRPELLLKDDPSTGEDILELNGRKFRCNSPYIYHGVINKVNCCYKKPQNKEITKKKPLKLFTKVKKGSTKLLEGTLDNYLSNEYVLYSVEDENKDRTLRASLEYIFGEEDIENMINNIDQDTFSKYFKDIELESWKNLQEKSINDIIKIVSVYTNTTILVLLDNLINGLSVECQELHYYEKYALIYRSNEKIQSFYPIIKNETKIHMEEDIKDLVEVSKSVCKSGFFETIFNYKDITVSQVTDYQNLVVFVEINSGGYIPVTPATPLSSKPVVKINSIEFKLLYPESQYKSLLSKVKNYPELEPVGLTKILNTQIITGIKIKNGGIVPVTHSIWEFSPLPTVEDLFYIEKYYQEGEDFSSQDNNFSINIEKVKEIENIKEYLENEDYSKLIEVITPITDDLDQITRLVWFLINN